MNATASPPPPHPHGIELVPGRCSKYLLGKCLEMEEQRLLSGNWGSLHSRASPSPSLWGGVGACGRLQGFSHPSCRAEGTCQGVLMSLFHAHAPEPETGACRYVPSQEAVPGAGTRVVSAETSPPGRGSRDKDRCGLQAARNLVGNSIPMRQLFIPHTGRCAMQGHPRATEAQARAAPGSGGSQGDRSERRSCDRW